jgi:hypothetical protein
MSNAKILAKLRDLHEELSTINHNFKLVEQVDHETIDALGQIVTDAGVLLDHIRDAPDQAPPESEHLDLVDRISKFESDHPSVTRLLSQVTDVLAMMGI